MVINAEGWSATMAIRRAEFSSHELESKFVQSLEGMRRGDFVPRTVDFEQEPNGK